MLYQSTDALRPSKPPGWLNTTPKVYVSADSGLTLTLPRWSPLMPVNAAWPCRYVFASLLPGAPNVDVVLPISAAQSCCTWSRFGLDATLPQIAVVLTPQGSALAKLVSNTVVEDWNSSAVFGARLALL